VRSHSGPAPRSIDLLSSVSLRASETPLAAQETSGPGCTEREKLACEGVGTFILALAAACTGAQDTPLGPVGVAGVLIGLIYSFGKLSKAIFNPAVCIALAMRGQISVDAALRYALVQLIASFAAGLTGFAIYGTAAAPAFSPDAVSSGLMGLLRAGLSEVLFTGVITSAVCHAGTHHSQEKNDVVGLSIGLTVLGCVICSDYSGSCFNPAMGVGLQLSKALVGGGFPVQQAATYVIAPSLGAVLATLVFQFVTCPHEP